MSQALSWQSTGSLLPRYLQHWSEKNVKTKVWSPPKFWGMRQRWNVRKATNMGPSWSWVWGSGGTSCWVHCLKGQGVASWLLARICGRQYTEGRAWKFISNLTFWQKGWGPKELNRSVWLSTGHFSHLYEMWWDLCCHRCHPSPVRSDSRAGYSVWAIVPDRTTELGDATVQSSLPSGQGQACVPRFKCCHYQHTLKTFN